MKQVWSFQTKTKIKPQTTVTITFSHGGTPAIIVVARSLNQHQIVTLPQKSYLRTQKPDTNMSNSPECKPTLHQTKKVPFLSA